MTTDDLTAAALELLDRERVALLSALELVPAADRGRRPAPGRWSANEVLEHLALVEGSVARLLAKRGREPAPPTAPGAAARLAPERVAWLRDRGARLEIPPGRIAPTGTVSTADALRALDASRAALTASFTAADPAALDGLTHVHPLLGELTLRAWVEFVAHHEARHAAQIAEIADALRTA